MGKISDIMKKYGKKADDIIIEIDLGIQELVDPSGKAKKARDAANKFDPKEAIKKNAKGGLIRKYGVQKKGTSPLLKKRK
jgi:hypothetical protein